MENEPSISRSQQRRLASQRGLPAPEFGSSSESERATPLSHPSPLSQPAPLMSILPENPESLTHEELLESYRELSLRVFNSENALKLCREVCSQHEKLLSQAAGREECLRDLLPDSDSIMNSKSFHIEAAKKKGERDE